MIPHSDQMHEFFAGLGYRPTLQDRLPARAPAPRRIRRVTKRQRRELELRSRESIGWRPFFLERIQDERDLHGRLEVPR